jgi:subtilase family serine protease
MSKRRAYLCLVLATVLSSLSYAVTPDRITGPLSGPMVTLPGNVNRKALPQYDQGRVDANMQMGTITLMTASTPAQVTALKTLLAQQQTPGSPNYHKWLTPEQFAASFGLSAHDIQQITTWLEQQGFTNVHAARARNWVQFSGTAAQVENAFNTQIHHYNVHSELHYANSTSPSVPGALAGIVTGIRGLDDFRLHPMGITRKPVPRPNYDSSIWGNLIAPGDIATIYDFQTLLNGGTDGTGYKLAVMGQTDIYLADLADFRSGFGLPSISCTANSSGVITACSDPHFSYVLNGSDPGVSTGDLEESDLDLEWSAAVAPGAQIVFVNTAPASNGVWGSFYYAIDNDLAPVISLSYGLCEFNDNNVLTSTGQSGADELELMQANSEGITFVNSSGDSGAAECDDSQTVNSENFAENGIAVSYPASSPEVTGVGGTAIPLANLDSGTYWGTSNGTTGGTAKSYIPEQNWNDDLEFYEYCQSNPTSGICEGSENGTGISITSETTAQEVIGIGSDGGGASNCAEQSSDNSTCVAGFTQPAWQAVSVNNQPSTRFSPDVSFLATPNFPGYIFCTPQSELGLSSTTSSCSPGGTAGITNALSLKNGANYDPSIIGGTSASAPVFAGIVVLLNQYLNASGGLGNINPMLYTLATNSPSAFHPVTTGDNNVACVVGTPSDMPTALQCPSSGVLGFSASNADSVTNFNLAAGLGSVNVDALAIAWKAAETASGFTLAPSVSSLSAMAGATTGSTTITATPANGFSGTVTFTCGRGLPTGATCNITPLNATSATLTVQTTTGMAAANAASLIVTGTSGAVSNSTVVALTVTVPAPTFTIAAAPTSTTVMAGNSVSNVQITVTPANGFTSQITFSCPGVQGVSCSGTATPTGSSPVTTSLTIATSASLAAGTTNLTVSGSGGGVTQTASVSLAVTATNQSFTLAIQGGNPSVTQGATASVNITVTGTNGFTPANSPLTYTCTTTAPEAQCNYPTGPTNLTTVSVQIATTAPSAANHLPNRLSNRGAKIFYAALLPGLLGIMFTAGSRKRSLRGMRLLGLIVALGCSTLWMASCSGSNNSSTANAGTPVGSYSVTVNATTGGAAPLTNQPPLTFTLTVTQ